MKKLLFVILVGTLLVGACAPPAALSEAEVAAPLDQGVETSISDSTVENTTQLTFTDDLGHTITLDGFANAIVSLGPSSLESLFAIGAGEQVVAREEYSSYPPEALELPSIGDVYSAFPLETILDLEPDLVIAPEIIAAEDVQSLVDLGIPVYWMANPQDFAGLYDNLRTLAQMTGHEEEAENLIGNLAERVLSVEDVIAYVENSPSVFYELDGTDPQNPWTVGSDTFIDTLIAMAGGNNAAATLSGEYAQISSEAIIATNPDVILLSDAEFGVSPESVGERAGWDVISAVQNDRVYAFDPYLVSVPGPRMVDGLEAMAALLHPDSF